MQTCYCGMASAIKENSAQSSGITQWGQNLKLKGCYCFLKRKKSGGVEHNKVPERSFASEIKCCCSSFVSLCLTSYNWTCHTLGLFDKKDMLDCTEMNSVIGVDQLVEKKASYMYVLGQMTLAIELRKSVC
jgi:hypothetical protein